jgi:hypothetical protein
MTNQRGAIPTKSRTAFSSGIENGVPPLLRNQNALDDPPSRFNARQTSKSGSALRALANSASERSLETPSVAVPVRATATKVLWARRD